MRRESKEPGHREIEEISTRKSREISTRMGPTEAPVREGLWLHPVHMSHQCGKCYWSPVKRPGKFLFVKSSFFPEENRQFLPGRLQRWAAATG